MDRKKRVFLSTCLFVWLLSCAGCQESDGREVSGSVNGGFRSSGLIVANGDLKDSGVEFEDSIVAFQDPVVEEMLRTIISKPEGDVRRSELQRIHAIYWRGQYWSDLQSDDGKLPKDGTKWYPSGQPETLEDLSWCDNLQWMEFSGITLPSLEPLLGLPQLEYISFYNTDVSPERLAELAQMPALTGLDLDFRNTASDHTGATVGPDAAGDGSFILPLADQLTYLEIGHPLTWSPDVLAQLTNLESLNICAPTDLGFLGALKNLRRLCISNCALEDWRGLAQADSLAYLMLIQCKGYTPEDLSGLTRLEEMILVMCPGPSRREIIDAIPSLTALEIK